MLKVLVETRGWRCTAFRRAAVRIKAQAGRASVARSTGFLQRGPEGRLPVRSMGSLRLEAVEMTGAPRRFTGLRLTVVPPPGEPGLMTGARQSGSARRIQRLVAARNNKNADDFARAGRDSAQDLSIMMLGLKISTGNGSIAWIWSPTSTFELRPGACASAPPRVGLAFNDDQPGHKSEYNVN